MPTPPLWLHDTWTTFMCMSLIPKMTSLIHHNPFSIYSVGLIIIYHVNYHEGTYCCPKYTNWPFFVVPVQKWGEWSSDHCGFSPVNVWSWSSDHLLYPVIIYCTLCMWSLKLYLNNMSIATWGLSPLHHWFLRGDFRSPSHPQNLYPLLGRVK